MPQTRTEESENVGANPEDEEDEEAQPSLEMGATPATTGGDDWQSSLEMGTTRATPITSGGGDEPFE